MLAISMHTQALARLRSDRRLDWRAAAWARADALCAVACRHVQVALLSAWRAQAEQTLASLQAQHSNLKLDHTEALSQAEELRKRLADR